MEVGLLKCIPQVNKDVTMDSKNGTLIMASNSLGNTLDIPFRSLEALRNSDLLIFEEDKPARLALKTAGVHREYLKFNEHKQEATIEELRACLKKGETACYMSDQGVPTLADPGRDLLSIAYQLNATVKVLPGPSSITAALAACPFLSNSFHYHGFLPREEADRIKELERHEKRSEPTVFLETPYRRKALLGSIKEVFGSNRMALLALDISGPNEEFIYNKVSELQKLEREKLNFVLVVEGIARPKVKQSKNSNRRKR